MDGSIDFIELKKDLFLLKFGIGLKKSRKKVLFLRKFRGMGVGKKYAFFESFGEWGLEESMLSSKVLGNGGWKKVRFLRKFWGMGVGRKFSFF